MANVGCLVYHLQGETGRFITENGCKGLKLLSRDGFKEMENELSFRPGKQDNLFRSLRKFSAGTTQGVVFYLLFDWSFRKRLVNGKKNINFYHMTKFSLYLSRSIHYFYTLSI